MVHPWFFPSPGRANAGKPNGRSVVSGMPLGRRLMPSSRSRPSCLLRMGCDLSAAKGADRQGGYFYVAARHGVCPIQVQGTTPRTGPSRG
jgi:hypothetical protein